jgi:hypothetical protein
LCEEEDENEVDEDDDKKSGISKGLRRKRFKSSADDVSAEAMKRRATNASLMIKKYAKVYAMASIVAKTISISPGKK